jgi:hypothetical protein
VVVKPIVTVKVIKNVPLVVVLTNVAEYYAKLELNVQMVHV